MIGDGLGGREEASRACEGSRSRVIVIAMGLLATATVAGQQAEGFHTPPGEWEQIRLFHSPFDTGYEARIRLGRRGTKRLEPLLVSPNQAYWAAFSPAADCEVSGGRAGCSLQATDLEVLVFTEREELLTIGIRDHYPNFQLNLEWVNEKLLFVRVWWGRVLGTDALIDVERGSFAYREMVHDGTIPFQQHRR